MDDKLSYYLTHPVDEMSPCTIKTYLNRFIVNYEETQENKKISYNLKVLIDVLDIGSCFSGKTILIIDGEV